MSPLSSVLLGQGFVIIAALLLVLARTGVKRASLACGDDEDVAAGLARRFDVWMSLWVLIAVLASTLGLFRHWDWRPPLFPFFALTMAMFGVVIARSAFGDRLARGLSLATLVLFQSFRLPLELLLHRAYIEGVMPVQMSYSGRNLDILSGASALVLGLLMLVVNVPKVVVWLWNLMGLALLVNIVGIAIVSTPLFQYFGPEHVNTFVADPPYVLLPAVMVLCAWAGHLIVFRALLHRR